VKAPPRDGSIFHRIVALEHGDLVRLLLGYPVPLVVRAVHEPGCLANAVIVNTVVVDVALICEGRPGGWVPSVESEIYESVKCMDLDQFTH
jgi:hypothetical protein